MNYSILDIFGGNEEKVETNYNYGCDTDGFVDVKVSNEIYMSEVEASYNRKIIGAFLCSISSIIIPAIVIILSLMNKGWLFRTIAFIGILPIGLQCNEWFTEQKRNYSKLLKEYKAAVMLFLQVRVKMVRKEENDLVFYFEMDDGTLKGLIFNSLNIKYSPTFDKNEMELDVRQKKITISAKYLLD